MCVRSELVSASQQRCKHWLSLGGAAAGLSFISDGGRKTLIRVTHSQLLAFRPSSLQALLSKQASPPNGGRNSWCGRSALTSVSTPAPTTGFYARRHCASTNDGRNLAPSGSRAAPPRKHLRQAEHAADVRRSHRSDAVMSLPVSEPELLRMVFADVTVVLWDVAVVCFHKV